MRLKSLQGFCIGCGSRKNTKGAMINGKFGQYCLVCIEGVKRLHHAGAAQYSRDRDREAHAVDLLQPWDARGNPSTEFIRHYPDEANDIFSKEELEQHG